MYNYTTYRIGDIETKIPDYYRLYYLPHCINRPIITDTEANKNKIDSVNRHLHILINYFNISCDVSTYEDGKCEVLIAVYATYIKYLDIGIKGANICIFGPAGCENMWSGRRYDGVTCIKFYSINLIQGSSKSLPDENCILGTKKEGKKIIYYPGRKLKNLCKKGFCYIFDNVHYAKNECLASDVTTCITKYINEESIVVDQDMDRIKRLKNKVLVEGKEKYRERFMRALCYNKIIFASDTLTDSHDITSILKCFGIISGKLIHGGRGIGSIKNYDQLRNFIRMSRDFNLISTRNIEKFVLSSNIDILLLENEEIQKKHSNNTLYCLVGSIFADVWVDILFSHIQTNRVDNIEIYNSFHKLKYTLKEDKNIFDHSFTDNTSVLTNFSSEIDSLEVASIPIIDGLIRDNLNKQDKVIVCFNRMKSIKILSKLMRDIKHILIHSEIDIDDELSKFDECKLVIGTVKSMCGVDISDCSKYVISSPIISAIESTKLIYSLSKNGISKVLVNFVNIIPSNVKEIDVYNAIDGVPIYLSTTYNNLKKASILSKYSFKEYSYTTNNIKMQYNYEPVYPKKESYLENYKLLRNKYK